MTETKPSQDHDSKGDSGIVWLASYPKSGNTWTRSFLTNLVTTMAGENTGGSLSEINRFSLGENFTSFFRDILGRDPKDKAEIAGLRHRVQREIADQFEGMVFVKTHNALLVDQGHSIINFEVTSGAIYIVRNPLDIAISLSHHINTSIDRAIEVMAMENTETPTNDKRVYEVWGSWSQHVESWTRKPHPAIHIMRYEDMLSDSRTAFSKLARHLLLNPTDAELDRAIELSSFENLKNEEQQDGFNEKPEHAERFFREGRAGQWKDILTREQIDRIIRMHRAQMMRFGYLPA
jgi:hypothetical protein